jgi:hypothetical protein
MKSISVGDRLSVRGQQKWNQIVFLFVFVCIRRVKATKMIKSRSNYSFLFFLSHIRKGRRDAEQCTWIIFEISYYSCNSTSASYVLGVIRMFGQLSDLLPCMDLGKWNFEVMGLQTIWVGRKFWGTFLTSDLFQILNLDQNWLICGPICGQQPQCWHTS